MDFDMKKIAVIVALLMTSLQVVSYTNPYPNDVPKTGCVLEANLTVSATIMWNAGTYNIYACGSDAVLTTTSTPSIFCTQIATGFNDRLISCLESS